MKIEDKDNNYSLKVNQDGSLNVSGTISVGPSTGNSTVVQPTGTNLHTVVDSGSITVVSGTAANLLSTVSGTVTAVSGTAANLLSQVSGTVTAVSGTAANLLAIVSQGTAANLLATVTVPGTVSVVQGTAANLLATVTVPGTVSVVQGTAANLLATVSGTVTAVSGTAANLLSQVSGTVTAVSGTAANLLATVSQGTAANLLATVSGTVAVTQGTATNLLATASVTAGTNYIGQVTAHESMSIYNGTAAQTVLYAAVAFTATGDNTVVAAVASKKIYVLSGLVMANAATNLKWWSTSTAGTAITGLTCLAANLGYQIPYCPIGNFVTAATNQALVLNSSAAATVGGWIVYTTL